MIYEVKALLISNVNHSTVGYQVVDETGDTLKISLEKAAQIWSTGSFSNATYNKYTGRLMGANGTKLNALPKIPVTVKKKQKVKSGGSEVSAKHENQNTYAKLEEAIKIYNAKSRLVNRPSFTYEILRSGIRVTGIESGTNCDVLEIPKFVTSIKPRSFDGCSFSKVIIHNSPKYEFDARELLYGLTSSSVIVMMDNPQKLTSTISMFEDCTTLRTIDLSNLDFSNVRTMRSMFNSCFLLSHIEFPKSPTTNVEDLSFLFHGCGNLHTIDLSSFKTSRVVDTSSMFNSCESLRELDLSHFDTTNVTDMSSMFYECVSLKDLNLNNFKTLKLRNIDEMFSGCAKLEILEAKNFDLSEVVYCDYVFHDCISLKSLITSDTKLKQLYNDRMC